MRENNALFLKMREKCTKMVREIKRSEKMREKMESFDDILPFAEIVWSYVVEKMRENNAQQLRIEVSRDRRRSKHYGGMYLVGINDQMELWSQPGILIALDCFNEKWHPEGFAHVEYPQIADHPIIGTVKGWEKMVKAAVCHEIAHAATEYPWQDELDLNFTPLDVKPFKDHSDSWIAVYADLRERFVNQCPGDA